MRGYSLITKKCELNEKLTNLMHGYKKDVENISEIYSSLFGQNIIKTQYTTSAEEISEIKLENLKILNEERFPLLNKTLIHTLTYLNLRLNVEKTLSKKFNINTNTNNNLYKIIDKSFCTDTEEDKNNRIFLLSRKTLLNEFNHFEVDMNIFQPAIDITNSALNKEKEDILEFLQKFK